MHILEKSFGEKASAEKIQVNVYVNSAFGLYGCMNQTKYYFISRFLFFKCELNQKAIFRQQSKNVYFLNLI